MLVYRGLIGGKPGQAVDVNPVERMSCLYPVHDSPTSRTPITSGDDLSSDDSAVHSRTCSTVSIPSYITDSGEEPVDEPFVRSSSSIEHEGYVKRKVIRKMGRKPSTGTKIFGIVRFWARIVDGCFILYSPKGRIKRRSREEFKDVEHCRVRLRDAVVALNTSTSRRKKPTLTLTDKNGMELCRHVQAGFILS
jgi:hypothetical protein